MRFRTAVPVSAGATSRVLRVFDETLGHEVALKLLHRSDPDVVQRMLREAEAQARLQHPHIARVHGTGTWEGQPYIAMDFIDGQTLDQAALTLSDRERAALLADVADALECAHRNGLVHRDLKPSNILVARGDNGRPHAYVIDFGVAHDAGGADLTRTGQILGTPGYIAPEVAAGATFDARSDIYSLGVILFEMLAGRRPFTGDSAAEVIVQSLRREPPPLQKYRPDIDPALARIVRQCLERDPDWRYASAAALREDLRAFAEGRRVAARRDTHWLRLRRFRRNHPWRAALAFLTILLATGMMGVLVHSTWYARQQSLKAQRFMDFAAGIEGSIRLHYLMPAHDIGPVRQQLHERVERFAADLRSDGGPAARHAGQMALGRAWAALGDDVRARQHLLRAWTEGERSPTLERLLGEVHLRLYWSAQVQAAAITDDELRQQRLDDNRRELRGPAEQHLARAARSDDPQALLAQALLHQLLDDREVALAHLDQVAINLDWPVDALLYGAGLLHQRSLDRELAGDYAGALDALQRARDRYLRAADIARSHPQALEGLCNTGGRLLGLARHGPLPPQHTADLLRSCDQAIALDPGRPESHSAKSAALAAYAQLQRSRAQAPDALVNEAIETARTALALHSRSRRAQYALGLLLTTRDAWLLDTGNAGDDAFTEAIAVLGQSHAGDPADAAAAMALAQAHMMRARLLDTLGHDPDPEYLKAERALAAVAPPAEAPPAIEAQLAETRAWRGFHIYDSGGDAEQLLRANYNRIRLVRHRVPGHPRIDRAFAYAAWTLADLLWLIGRDPATEAEAAVDAYEALLAQDPHDFTSLFNITSLLYLLIDHRITKGDDVSHLLSRLQQHIDNLVIQAGDRTPIDIQLQSLAMLRARVAIRDGRDPRAEFQASRRHFQRAAANPVDRKAALMLFADLVELEHRWRHSAGRGDPALLAADLALVEDAADRYTTSAPLRARIARILVLAPHDPRRIRKAVQLLADALERMPLLHSRHQPDMERLLLLAGDRG